MLLLLVSSTEIVEVEDLIMSATPCCDAEVVGLCLGLSLVHQTVLAAQKRIAPLHNTTYVFLCFENH